MEDLHIDICAALLDGTITPLQKIVYKNQIDFYEDSEAYQIARDIKSVSKFVEKMDPVEITACKQYIDDLRKNIERSEFRNTKLL